MKMESDKSGSFFLPDIKGKKVNGVNKVNKKESPYQPKRGDINMMYNSGLITFMLMNTLNKHGNTLRISDLYNIYYFRPKQLVWRPLQLLVKRGYVIKDDFKRYQLSKTGKSALRQAYHWIEAVS